MHHRHDTFIEEIIGNPYQFYKNPYEVLMDLRLTADEKIKVLDTMEHDQVELMEAENENMTAPTQILATKPAEKLRAIQTAKHQADQQINDDQDAL